jgi:hypothetical protein
LKLSYPQDFSFIPEDTFFSPESFFAALTPMMWDAYERAQNLLNVPVACE